MDDNYLMRKEGLTMTNENSVKHKSVAWAWSRVGATRQPWIPAPSLCPSFPAWQEPIVLSKLRGTFGCWFWRSHPTSWVSEPAGRLQTWQGRGGKMRVKNAVRKKEQGKKKKNLVKWEKEKDAEENGCVGDHHKVIQMSAVRVKNQIERRNLGSLQQKRKKGWKIPRKNKG